MRKYDVNYRKLALLLLPLRLRKPLLAALIYSAVQPLRELNMHFRTLREESKYNLTHNGQVCYLRAAINDVFDVDDRRITITEAEPVVAGGSTIISVRDDDTPLAVAQREDANPTVIHRRGYIVAVGADFQVNIPSSLKDSIDAAQLAAVISKYKLVSKRYAINYIQ